MFSLNNAKNGYDFLVNLIIRPARHIYKIEDLGPKIFRIGNKKYIRSDIQLTNKRNLKLQCSFYEEFTENTLGKQGENNNDNEKVEIKQKPCVIYCHGNCGCRLDAVEALPVVLPLGISLFSIDFSGSGLSDGEYISLGYYEAEDVEVAVEYLRRTGQVSTISLWGRSMGAATSLLFSSLSPSLSSLILDSPFSSLHKLAQELVDNAETPVNVPQFAVSLGMKMIRKSIKSKANFDIEALAPIKHVDSCFAPALFIHGKEDNFILPHHSQELYEKYAGDKNIIMVEGNHNSARPSFCKDSISIFLVNTLLGGKRENDPSDVQSVTSTSVPQFQFESYQPSEFQLPTNDEEAILQQVLLLSMQEANNAKQESLDDNHEDGK